MVKQVLIPLVAVAIFIALVGYFTKNKSSVDLKKYINIASPSVSSSQNSKTVKIAGKIIDVEIADNLVSRETGLGGRNYLASGTGMLFVFDKKGEHPNFWMKGMLIPIDIIWISGGKVVKIDKNVPAPAPGTPDASLTIYSSEASVDHVLEVSNGYSDKNNIKIDDGVELPN